jgi:hypothetical protein
MPVHRAAAAVNFHLMPRPPRTEPLAAGEPLGTALPSIRALRADRALR